MFDITVPFSDAVTVRQQGGVLPGAPPAPSHREYWVRL